MENWKKICITPEATIREAIATIEIGGQQIAIIVDSDGCLVGTITDGDIRRGILAGEKLDDTIRPLINFNPLTMSESDDVNNVIELMRVNKINKVPVVDSDKKVVRVESIEDLNRSSRKENWVVLMAGGLGSRLKSLTEECPKPMLLVGGKPILEIILEALVQQGYYKFFISVNYLAEIIKRHFGCGKKWGVEIRYLEETKRLGTAGALTLLPSMPEEPVFIMNGDIISNINLNTLGEYHASQRGAATMVVRQYFQEIPYGVVNIQGKEICSIEEKPQHKFFINAGVYVINPEVIAHIPSDQFYDMPTLFKELVFKNIKASAFPIYERWIDVGRLEDFYRAQKNDF